MPALNVRRQATVFAPRRMLLVGEHFLISRPEIRVTMGLLVSGWYLRPQPAAGRFTTVPDDEGHDLARGATAAQSKSNACDSS